MKNLRRYAVILTFCGLAAGFAGFKARAYANPPAPGAAVSVELNKVIGKPGEFDGQAIVFSCRFAATGKLFRQNDRQFTSRTYANFSVWPDGAPLWDKSARRNTLPSLYINRENSTLMKQLGALRRYDLVVVTGTITDTYANMPWIEVTSLQAVSEKEGAITDALLNEISRGVEMLGGGNKVEAARILQSAVSTGVPAYIADYVQSQIAQSLPKPVQEREVTDHLALIAAGRAAAAKGDIAGAIEQYRKAGAGASPVLKEIWFYRELGQLFLISRDADRYAKARNLFAHANDMSGGKDVLSLACLGQIAAEQKDFVHAEEFLNQSLKLDPQNVLASKLLAKVVAAQQAVRESAKPVTGGVVALAPASALQAGRDSMQRGDFTQAEQHLRTALTASEGDVVQQARTLLASVLLAQNKTAEAMKFLESAPVAKSSAAHAAEVSIPQAVATARSGHAITAEPQPASRSNNVTVLPEVTLDDLDQATKEMNRIGKELEANTGRPATTAKPINNETQAPGKLSQPATEAPVKTLAQPTVKKSEQPAKPITRTTTDSSLPDWAL